MKYILILVFSFMCLSSIQSQIVAKTEVKKDLPQIQLPYNRFIQPAGIQIFFGDEALENHSLDVVLSPDSKWLAVEERYSIIFISTSDNMVRYRLSNNIHPYLRGGMNTYSGITWHYDNGNPEVYWGVIGSDNRSFLASARWNGLKAEFGRL